MAYYVDSRRVVIVARGKTRTLVRYMDTLLDEWVPNSRVRRFG
jgi:hypothetical protein